jgi:subtilisin-like proprotein convertase family protein
VRAAHVNRETDMTPTDPLFATQWHFSLMGDIERIWDEYSGAGVHVGVYDDGIDLAHADLLANYDATRQVRDNLNNVVGAGHVAAGDGHGTATAGLIGAANNGVGGVGVAWGTSLTAVNIFGGAGVYGDVNGPIAPFLSVVHQAAANYDISSNSWGSTPTYDTSQRLSGTGFAAQLNTEYAFLSSTGRGGRGTIITQAAGNDTLDANGDGVNASRYTITVSATEQTGIVANYSNFGSSVLIAAPAAAVTTDRSGTAGYDPTDYTNTFNGTSAATPVVSGVIALMLQANPALGWRDVQNILANSASHTGSAFGGPKAFDEHGVWQFNKADNWNGGGMHSQIDYGYGMVNAFNAVRMAEVWTLFGAAQVSANEVTTSSAVNNLGGLVIPDNNATGVSFNLTVGTNLQIEHVQLVMNFNHAYAHDLKVTLTSAEGTQIVVALNNGSTPGAQNGEWVFGVDSLRGELSAGTWTVNVQDLASLDTGTITSASLNLFGTTVNANDVFHFTDEFLDMKALDPTRGVISDADGGIDWLNFAAIVPNVFVNMNSGQGFSVGGVTWGTLGATTVIENAIGGDGNDGLFGNASNNTLYGMRGNDALVGYGANDVIFGGAGNDTLLMDDYGNPATTNGNDYGYGDAGLDLLWGYGGNDNLFGGADNDSLVGNDYASAVAGLDALYGGDGVDTLFVGLGGNAYMDGGTGNDTFFGGAISDTLRGGTGSDYLYGNTGVDFFQFYAADFAANDADIVYFMDPGDRLKFSASLNGTLFLQDIASLQYDSNPLHTTTGVYITAFLAGGAQAHITVYGMTVASLTPVLDYTL